MSLSRLLTIALAGAVLTVVPTGCQFPGPAVSVAFTSHVDGERIVGSRTVTVAGSLQGTAPSAFSLSLNGTPVTVPLPSAGTFSVTLTLADGANTVAATASAASGASSTATLQLIYPYLDLSAGQAAGRVIGQTSFTASLGDATQQRLRAPAGAPVLIDGRLYLADTGNNRALGLTGVPAVNGPYFDVLLGQTSWTASAAAPVGAGALAGPSSVADAGGRLLVTDTGNNRVLLFDGAPTLTDSAARVAVGQAGLYSNGDTTCTAGRLDHPRAAILAGGKLVVADSGHHRVLIWDSVPTASGSPADLVLGQEKLVTLDDPQYCQANRGVAAPTAATLSTPSGVWSDGSRLVVADTGNQRLLVWTAFPTSDGQPADLVVGQAGMTTAAAGVGPSGLNSPWSVDSNGNQLFVADTGNHRVLVFSPFPAVDGAAASVVLGQADFTGSDANRGAGTSAATLSGPEGVRAFDGMLMVADTGNARELLYLP